MELLEHQYTKATSKAPKFIFDTVKGINKRENQDNLLIIPEPNFQLFAVFDGVSSAKNSRQATLIAIEFIKNNYQKFLTEQVCLDKLMEECNNYILQKRIPETYTTYCILYLPHENSNIIYSSLGDSRIYEITGNNFEQLTTDDKLLGYNIITKCLGMDTLTPKDFFQTSIEKSKSNFLICTDGFYEFFEDDRFLFLKILNEQTLDSVKEKLINKIQNRNHDDCTFIYFKI